MAYVRVRNAVVDFPIYDQRRSLRHAVLINPLKSAFTSQSSLVGGRITKRNGNRVVINSLDDINFDLKDGDRLGLIGHNGAGKSTLLRMVSGIYEPVSGSVEISGRLTPVFNLMEGIDMDSSGMEAIRMRGLLMGLSNTEIDGLYDDLVDFTSLHEYLEMPIRTYSTGMLVRLAFGLATSMKPEILVMDEAIGAGDASFLEKARDRLETFLESAGIIIVASHANEIIRAWCNKVMVLHKGRVVHLGDVEEGFEVYHRLIHPDEEAQA